MAIDPMIAYGIRPPQVDTMEEARGRVMQMRHLQQAAESGDIDLRMKKTAESLQLQAIDDERKARDVWAEAAGDLDKFFSLAPARGVSPKTVQAMQTAYLEHKTKLAGLTKAELENAKEVHARTSSLLQELDTATPEQRPALWPQLRDLGIQRKYFGADDVPDTYPGDDWLRIRKAEGVAQDKLYEQSLAAKNDARAAQTTAADLATKDAERPGKAANSRAQQLAAAGQSIAGVADQTTYDQWYAAQPPEMQKYWGPMFSAPLVKRIEQAGMDANQRAVQAGAADSRSETARANRASEANVRRGQDQVDRRSHESLQIQGGQQAAAAEGKLRDDYRKESQNFITVRDSYQRMETAATSANGAGDLSMVYGLMKMLDPGSTVREGEYANAAQVGGPAQQWLNTYNRLVAGDKLPDAARAQIMGEARKLMTVQQTNQGKIDRYYTDLSGRYRLNPQNVLTDYGTPGAGGPPPQQPPPAAGAPAAARTPAAGAAAPVPAGRFRQTATGAGGQRIGSNDGVTWFDLATGRKVQ
jgi:hypothetical protein